MPDIICLGEPMVEFVRAGPPGGADYRRGFGGDTSNAAVAAARQGASVGYVTALGDDPFGRSLRAMWAEEGVDASAVVTDPAAATGIYFVEPDPAGRFFTYYRAGSAASRLTPAALPAAYLSGAKMLHLSGITLAVSADLRASAFRAMEIVRGAGGAVSLDTNLRLKLWPAEEARRVIEQAAAEARILITSIDDSEALLGLAAPEAIAAHYRALGPEIVLVTQGAEGCLLAAGDVRVPIPPAPADPVDSTGAGDSFAGAFLAYLIETGDPETAARRAAVVAAGTVSGYGATAPIPRRSEIVA